MAQTSNISPAIVESLYEQSLLLADEARAALTLSGNANDADQLHGSARVALSCEALRTTTRMMHAIAWLLNHRAFFKGELSEFQLRRHGRLPPPQPESDPEQLALLEPEIRDLIDQTKRFYSRLARLDDAWQKSFAMQPPAVERLRDRISTAFARR